MSDEIVTNENLSIAMLKALYDAAYIDNSIDSDGDLVVGDGYRAYVFLDQHKRDIRLAINFGSNPRASLSEKQTYVNKINDDLVWVRAYIRETGGIGFDYFIPVEGGITKKNIIVTTKRFFAIVQRAIEKDDRDVIA